MEREKPSFRYFAAQRSRIHEVIFEADTPTGKAFDVLLLSAIICSVIVVMLESVESIEKRYGYFIRLLEWSFTVLFTIEYFLRIISVHRPLKYIFSFYGLVDLMSILPTYISLFLTGAQYLLIVRIMRLLRMFRILKLSRYVRESRVLMTALRQSLPRSSSFSSPFLRSS